MFYNPIMYFDETFTREMCSLSNRKIMRIFKITCEWYKTTLDLSIYVYYNDVKDVYMYTGYKWHTSHSHKFSTLYIADKF